LLALQIGAGRRLHVRRNLVQGHAEALQWRIADDHDLGQLLQRRRIGCIGIGTGCAGRRNAGVRSERSDADESCQ